MDEHMLARTLGWGDRGRVGASRGPRTCDEGYRHGLSPQLGVFLGVRDLVLGTALLRGHNTAICCRTWLS